MRKILFTLFILASLIACAQETNYSDLPVKSTYSGTDGRVVMVSGVAYSMTSAVLFGPTNDSIAALRADISTNYDSLFFTRNGTSLSPKTAGDDILLRTSSEILSFGDGDTYIQEAVDDVLHFFVGGTSRWNLSTTNFNLTLPITPTPNKTVDFGGASNFFKDGYTNKIYFANTNTYIDTTGANLRFTDATTGTKTLSELAAGGSGDSASITYQTDSIYNLTPGSGVTIEGVKIQDDGPGYATINVDETDIMELTGSVIDIFTDIYMTDAGDQIFIGTTNQPWIGRDAGNNLILSDTVYGDTATLSELAESRLSINAQTGTTYTLVLTDKGKLVTLNNASAITLTVPPNSSVAFPIGTQISIVGIGAGQVTVAEGSGVTVSAADSQDKLRVQYSTATLIKIATDIWLLIGDITS